MAWSDEPTAPRLSHVSRGMIGDVALRSARAKKIAAITPTLSRAIESSRPADGAAVSPATATASSIARQIGRPPVGALAGSCEPASAYAARHTAITHSGRL